MKIIIKHDLSKMDAVKCSKNILESLRHEHAEKITNVVEVWTENKSEFSFRFNNLSITGNIEVKTEQIEISGKLPLAAKLFKALIENTIKKEARKLLNKCDAGDDKTV